LIRTIKYLLLTYLMLTTDSTWVTWLLSGWGGALDLPGPMDVPILSAA